MVIFLTTNHIYKRTHIEFSIKIIITHYLHFTNTVELNYYSISIMKISTCLRFIWSNKSLNKTHTHLIHCPHRSTLNLHQPSHPQIFNTHINNIRNRQKRTTAIENWNRRHGQPCTFPGTRKTAGKLGKTRRGWAGGGVPWKMYASRFIAFL